VHLLNKYKEMLTIGIVIGVIFLIGLVARDKGDGFLDTLSSGCATVLGWIIILAIIAAAIYFIQ